MSSGQPLSRIEGAAKVTGRAKYAADNYPAGMLHAVLVGAPIAAGRITAIDSSAALALPGVVRVLTRADMPKFGALSLPAAVSRLPMQDDTIEYEGQPIAIVLAETLEAAEAAAASVRVSTQAAQPLVPRGSNGERVPGELVLGADADKGDVDRGLRAATRRVDREYSQASRHHNPMEPSATIAAWDDGKLVMHDAVQCAYNVPQAMARALGVSERDVQVIAPHTGGGFGCKGYVWPHQFLAAAAARSVARPVKVVLTRAQMYAACGFQPHMRQTVTLGCGDDGRLTALRHDAVNVTSISDDYVEATTEASKGLYASQAIRTTQRVERVHTIVPTPMRAPNDGSGTWAIESAMDELAAVLGVDPLDLRLANYAEVDPLHGKPWSSKKLREAYDEGARLFGWRERTSRPRRDGVWHIGFGMATATMGDYRFPSTARVRVKVDGGAIIETGTHDIGTGTTTILVQIAAEELGIDPGNVEIRWGDTALPVAGPVYGSSSTMGTGGAVLLAARDLKAKLAKLTDGRPEEIDVAAAMRGLGLAELAAEGKFALPNDAPFDAHGEATPYAMRTWGGLFLEVGVDPELGLIRLRRAVGSYSAGRIINPKTARSQMIGGIVWGWGMATMEESVQEPRHGRWLAKNLSNVAIPVNADIPSAITIHFVDEFDPHASPIGGRGIGELGATGVAAAVANAVYDAIGVRVRDLPIVPSKIIAMPAAAGH
jgi:xanthine dehydrogenase YagR molybdenum-binding subunit